MGPSTDASPTDAVVDRAPPTIELDVLVALDNQTSGDGAVPCGGALGAMQGLIHQLADTLPAGGSIRIAGVSGDLGVGAVVDAWAGCDSQLGQDALFAGTPGGPTTSSAGMLPPDGILTFTSGDAVSPFVGNMFWALTPIAQGCNRQQALEAALKALSPAPDAGGGSPVSWTADGYVPPTFFGDTGGHGGPGGANEAFLRPESVLLVLVATPFDDCSVPDPTIFSESDPRYADTPIRLRCQRTPDPRYPISRYVQGLLGLRRHPSRLVLAAVTGIPVADAFLPPGQILADPMMEERTDPVFPDELAVVCRGGGSAATPARRIVSTAAEIERRGGHVVLSSACDTDMLESPLATHLADAVRSAMAGTE